MILELLIGGAVWLGAEKLKRGYGDKQKLDRVFRKCGLYVKYNGQEDTPKLLRVANKESYTEYVYRLPEGLSFKDFEKKHDVIEQSLNSSSNQLTLSDVRGLNIKGNLKEQIQSIKKKKNNQKEVVMEYKKLLTLKVYHECLKERYVYDGTILKGLKEWEVAIGHTLTGIIKHDMQKHMIVAGATDYGKTNVIKLMITQLLERKQNDTILTLIDLKGGLAFSRFKGIPQLNGIAKSVSEAIEVLKGVKEQLVGVFNYLEENSFEDVKEAGINKRHFIFIDECAELSSNGEKDTEMKALKIECEQIMADISRRGRAAGFYIIYSTQYPTAEVLGTQIKQQCDARLCLRVKNDYASKVVIDQEGAEKLPQIKGRAIYQTSENIILQVPKIDNEYIEGVVKNASANSRQR